MRMVLPCLLPLALAIVAYLSFTCGGTGPEPTAEQAPSQAIRFEAKGVSDTHSKDDVATTLAPEQHQTEAADAKPAYEESFKVKQSEAKDVSKPYPKKTASTTQPAAPKRLESKALGAELTRSETKDVSEPSPTVTVVPTETAVPEPQQTAITESESIPVRTEPPSCELVQGVSGQPGEVQLHVEVIVEGLEIPWGLALLPTGDLLVTERPGRVRLIQDGKAVPEPVLEFGVSMPPPLYGIPLLGSEGGLLGLLLHPEFASNRQFYIFYNIDNENDLQIGRIERYVLSDDGRSASFDRVILDDLPAGLHHQGGRMRIGPDGMLYVAVGAYLPSDAQDPESLAGKLLRMDLEGRIPADNPEADSYIFASGMRNSQGYDWFDDQHIVMVEHGPSGIELNRRDLRGFDELNVVTAGDNLGWPSIWGCDVQEGLVRPVLAWEDPVPPTGAIFYRGDLISEWTDSFLFTTVGLSDTAGGRHLHRVVFEQNDPYTILAHEVYLKDVYGRLRTIVSDSDGRLYVMTSNCDNRGECPPEGDKILRIGPAR